MPTAKLTPAEFAALAARGRGGDPGPWLTVTVVVPVATKGTLNSREHWAARARRVKGEREATLHTLRAAGFYAPDGLRFARRVRVTLTRVNGGKLDSDNLSGVLKACRDATAEWYGVDDGDPCYEWRYAQEPGRGPAQVRITFEVGG